MDNKNKDNAVKRGNFVLNRQRCSVPTDVSMYDCVDCLNAGIEHKIIEIAGPPAPGNEVSNPGDPTTINRCTGCGAQTGPWVPAPW